MKKRNLMKLLAFSSTNINQNKTIKAKIKAFFRMIRTAKKVNYKLNYISLFLGFFTIFYFIFPLDFIPEIAFGPFGLVDDFAILMFGMKFLNKEVIKFIRWEEDNQNLIQFK